MRYLYLRVERYLSSGLKEQFPAGVITGDAVQELFEHTKANQFALPGPNCIGTNSVNAVLETAQEVNAPITTAHRLV